MSKIKILPKKIFGSDVIVDLLIQQGIEYIACNPGASIRGLENSILHRTDAGALKFILCCHEEIAVAVARGYAKATGKYMAVLLHTNVGVQHACMAVFNAWCDRVPMLLIGGVGPLDITQRRPWIDWIHTSFDQASVLRGFIKWEDQPVNLPSTLEALARAIQLANTEPKAPVYVGIDARIQEEIMRNTKQYKKNAAYTFNLPSLPQADKRVLEQLADWLVKARFPVIIVDYMGKNPESVKHLMALAELLVIPVIDKGGRYNFPNTHSLYVGSQGEYFLKKTDCLLAIDVQDIYGALGSLNTKTGKYISYFNSKQKTAHIHLNDYLVSSLTADYQKKIFITLPITANSLTALPELLILCQARSNFNQKNKLKIKKRYLEIKIWREAWQKRILLKVRKSLQTDGAIPIPAALSEIWQVIQHENWMLGHGGNIFILEWVRKLWRFEKPGCYLGFSGGAGLGYGLGASIGAALDCKTRGIICIDLQTDGDFLFTPSALWSAAHGELPLLIIMMNNRAYQNTKEHAKKIAIYRQQENRYLYASSVLNFPYINYSKLAESFGLKSFEAIYSIKNIKTTLIKAIQYIKLQQKPVLIDIIIE